MKHASPSVHLGEVVALDAGDAVEGHVASKGHSQVITQAQQLATCTAWYSLSEQRGMKRLHLHLQYCAGPIPSLALSSQQAWQLNPVFMVVYQLDPVYKVIQLL